MLTNPDNVLVHNTAGANVQMADLRVAHEALGETDGGGGSLQLAVVLLVLGEGVHLRGVGVSDSIAILGRLVRRDTPAIDHDCKRSAT